MLCKKCGFELDSGVKFCPKCGERIVDNSASDTNTPAPEMRKSKRKKKKGKGKVIIAIILVLLLIGGFLVVAGLGTVGGVLFFTSPGYKVMNNMNKGDYDQAVLIYTEDVANNALNKTILNFLMGGKADSVAKDVIKDKMDIDTALNELMILEYMGFDNVNEARQSIAENLVSDYNEGAIDYKTVISELEILYVNGFLGAEDYINSINSDNGGAAAVSRGDSFREDGDYASAIEAYNSVDSFDSYYSDAQQKLATVCGLYIDAVAEEVEKATRQDDYASAFEAIKAAYKIIPDTQSTAALDTVLDACEEDHKDYVKGKAESKARADKYEEALELIDEAIELNSSTYLSDLRSEYEEKYIEYVTKKVEQYVTDNKDEDAATLLEKALGIIPGNRELTQLKNDLDDGTLAEKLGRSKLESFILNSDKKYFTKDDIKDFTSEELRIARNGIYAIMGRKFNDKALTDYFNKFDWYKPVYDPDHFPEEILNDYQVANRDLIIAYEEEKGRQ
ncbi:MAG: YARHG domain-containing protein [Clostridia bacterium]|nr:YARHG domain-containing protein [Clostridia bacterium]